jgi:hypothetical protein
MAGKFRTPSFEYRRENCGYHVSWCASCELRSTVDQCLLPRGKPRAWGFGPARGGAPGFPPAPRVSEPIRRTNNWLGA